MNEMRRPRTGGRVRQVRGNFERADVCKTEACTEDLASDFRGRWGTEQPLRPLLPCWPLPCRLPLGWALEGCLGLRSVSYWPQQLLQPYSLRMGLRETGTCRLALACQQGHLVRRVYRGVHWVQPSLVFSILLVGFETKPEKNVN